MKPTLLGWLKPLICHLQHRKIVVTWGTLPDGVYRKTMEVKSKSQKERKILKQENSDHRVSVQSRCTVLQFNFRKTDVKLTPQNTGVVNEWISVDTQVGYYSVFTLWGHLYNPFVPLLKKCVSLQTHSKVILSIPWIVVTLPEFQLQMFLCLCWLKSCLSFSRGSLPTHT